jgi:DHA2 family multidrug resistance protein
VLGGVLFVWHELATKHPAVDLRVLKHRTLVAGCIYSLVLGMGLYGVMFAVPVFVQTFLHFTPTQSGYLLMPGGLASAFMMVAMSKITPRVDARILIGCGALMTAVTALSLARINPDTGTETLFYPLILRGLGTVTMFLPLSLATLSDLPRKDRAAGSGLYSLARQMGSSIGIAIITTLLIQREFVHRAVLAEKITASSPVTTARVQLLSGGFAQHSANPVLVHQQAFSLIDQIVNGQAMLLSFADVFFYVAGAFVITLPLLLLLGRGGKTDSATVAH